MLAGYAEKMQSNDAEYADDAVKSCRSFNTGRLICVAVLKTDVKS